MNFTQKRIDEIRNLLAVADKRYTSDPDAYRCVEAEAQLQKDAVSYIRFLLMQLDEANADKQRLINGLWNLPLPAGGIDVQEVLDSVGENPAMCEDHRPRQHRDARPPWCPNCGLTKDFRKPTSKFDKR